MPSTPTRILVPTDFSTTAENARSYAARLATVFGAEAHSLHVQVLPEDPHLDADKLAEIRRLLATGDSQREQDLQRDEQAPEESTFQPHLVRAMGAAEAIVSCCDEFGCDLIVMGTHGRRGLKGWILGSVAEEVVRTASVPVITVRSGAACAEASRILVPHDFSDHSVAALEVAAAWARKLRSALTLLHVVEPTVYPDLYAVDVMPHGLVDQLRERSAAALERAAAQQMSEIETEVVVVTGRPGDIIVEQAEDRAVDLIVMGTRGLSPITEVLLGSVAETVLRRSSVPLLTFRE